MSLEQQLLALYAANEGDSFFSSAQSDTEVDLACEYDDDELDEPLPLEKIDETRERQEFAQLQQQQQQQQQAKTNAKLGHYGHEGRHRHYHHKGGEDAAQRRAAIKGKLRERTTPIQKVATVGNTVDEDELQAFRDYVNGKSTTHTEAINKSIASTPTTSFLGHHHHHHRERRGRYSPDGTGIDKKLEATPDLNVAPEDANVDGIFSWFQSTFLNYKLYPLSASQVSHIPDVIRNAGNTGLLPLRSTVRTDTISIYVPEKENFTQKVALESIQGVPGSFVYATNYPIMRSHFFKTTRGSVEGVFVDLKFTLPPKGEPKKMRLEANVETHGDETDVDTYAPTALVWATPQDRSGLSVVLRFAPDGSMDAILKQVIVLFTSKGASVAATAVGHDLTVKEVQLAQHILSGQLVPLETLHDMHTIADASAAYIAVAMANCQLRAAYSHVDVPHPTATLAAGKDTRPTMSLFKKYATDITSLGSAAQDSGTVTTSMAAQRRGELLAQFILSKLAGVNKEKIFSTLHALNNVAEVFYMRMTAATAPDVRDRTTLFWNLKDKGMRANPAQLFEAFYG